MAIKTNRYTQLIDQIFHSHYQKGDTRVSFTRNELVTVSERLGIELPKNLGDIPYSFRYRANLPNTIVSLAPRGMTWVIKSTGRSKYEFVLIKDIPLGVNEALAVTKVPDATPGIVSMYALGDEQSLLTKIRYNRLIDIFTGVTCYSLQNHLRTTVPDMGQVETDELYIGIDKRGAHYVLPVQAKAENEKLGPVQIEQDFSLCASKFPNLVCRPVGAQFIEDNFIALFEYVLTEEGVRVAAEKHYRLVPPESIAISDLLEYKQIPVDNP